MKKLHIISKRVKQISKRLSPLCFLPNGKLICYKGGKLVLMTDESEEISYSISSSKLEKLISRSKLFSRLLRLGIRTAVALDDYNILLSKDNMIHEFDLHNGKLSKGYFLGDSIRPLIFTSVKNLIGFDNTIYFGGYLINKNKNPVNIFKRVGVDKWEVVYTFPQGTINHVHNIISDSYRNCLWIFTGDFDDAAAIWKVTNNFKTVKCVLSNKQIYRACVVFPLKQGLLYATDSPFTENYIYLMKDDLSLEKILKIDGSCIYGCQCGDKYVFSSTVEADGRNQTLLKLMFSKKLGAGITDKYVRLYTGNLKEGFKVKYKEKKDCLPFIFQFGVFRFPKGENNSNKLYFQPVATYENDLVLMRLEV